VTEAVGGVRHGCASIEDLYAPWGTGKFRPGMGGAIWRRPGDLREQPESRIARVVKRALGLSARWSMVRGLDEVMVYLAQWLRPHRGSRSGDTSSGARASPSNAERCPNVERLLYDPSAASTWPGREP